jgi:O-antigen/teichoic acid export membrane protein
MSLRIKAISGTLWTATSSVVLAIIQILKLSILTRFLEKSDFGLVAIVGLILGFTSIFSDLGITVSLFSKQEISRKTYSSLYWISMISSLVLYLILYSSVSLFVSFYKFDELEQLIPLMGLDLIIATAGRQFRVFRQKRMQFKILALIDIGTSIFSLIIAIAIAMKGGGVLSIVYSTLFASLTSSIILIISGLRTHPLSLYINFNDSKNFYKIGFYQTGSQILDYFASQIDILIIGKVMTISDLGTYNLIKQLALRVFSLITPIITRVAIPLLSSLQDNLIELKTKYLKMLSVISLINVYTYSIIALSSKEILAVLYGNQYANDSIYLQLFCLWGTTLSFLGASSTIIVAKGQTKIGFKWTVLRLTVNPAIIVAGSYWGLKGIVTSMALWGLIAISLYHGIVLRKVISNTTFKAYSNTFWPVFLKTILLLIILNIIKSKFIAINDLNYIVSILFNIIFTALFIVANKEYYSEIKQILKLGKINI